MKKSLHPQIIGLIDHVSHPGLRIPQQETGEKVTAIVLTLLDHVEENMDSRILMTHMSGN